MQQLRLVLSPHLNKYSLYKNVMVDIVQEIYVSISLHPLSKYIQIHHSADQ